MYTINPLLFLLSTIVSLSRTHTNIFNTYLRVFLKNNMIATYLLQNSETEKRKLVCDSPKSDTESGTGLTCT